MSDIVERLRSYGLGRFPREEATIDMLEAADTIERLRAVLLYITELDDDSEAPILARRALENKP